VDDLVAALHLLAQKLRVDVEDMADRYVLYVQISAVVLFFVYIVIAYVAYRVIDYCHKQYLKANPVGIVDAKTRGIKDELRREVSQESNKILRNSTDSAANVLRVVLMALIMGSFLIAAACEIPAIAMPRGKALDNVLESLKDATKVEIVQPRQDRSASSAEKSEEAGDRGEEDGSGRR
jgi:hypothetical protein